LKISGTHFTSATFEMAHKLKKIEKNWIFLLQVYMVSLHLPLKFQLKILLFDFQSEVPKIDEEYVNILEACVCMWAWGACGLASGG
jgi:hypothetical protein